MLDNDVVDDVTSQMVPVVSLLAVTSVFVDRPGSGPIFRSQFELLLLLLMVLSVDTLTWKRRDDVTEEDGDRELVHGRVTAMRDLTDSGTLSLLTEIVRPASFG